MIGRSGWCSWPVRAWEGGTRISCKALQRVSTSEYHVSKRPTPLLITPHLDLSSMYIVKVSKASLPQGITSALSPRVSWNRPSALFSPLLCHLFQKRRNQALSEQSIISLTHILPPSMPHPSTHTSLVTTSPVHGAPSQQLHFSFLISPLVPKRPYAMSQRCTGQSPFAPTNGLGWSFDYRPMTSMQLMSATTLASLQQAECMACWLTQGQIFSGHGGWARLQSGLMTTSSFESPIVTYPVTTRSTVNGTARSWRVGVTGRRVEGYGSGAKVSPVGRQRSSTRTVAKSFVTSCKSPHDPPAIRNSPTQMQTSMSYWHASESGGKPPSRYHSEWRCPTWVSTGTCAPNWCIFQTRRKPSTWQPSQTGRASERTTSWKRSSSTASLYTQLWSSQPDVCTSQTWRPCWPPSITVLSFHTPLPKIPLTIWPGGGANSGAQTSSSPSQGPIPSPNTEHTQTPVLASAWLSQWVSDGECGSWRPGGDPRGETFSGPKPLALSSSPSVYTLCQAKVTTSSCAGTIEESSKASGKGAAPTSPPIMFSDTSSSSQRTVISWYRQDMY